MATVDRRGVTLESIDTPIAGGPSATLAIKAPCLVATTGNIDLDGVQAIDGVSVGNNNERVLVWQQADQTTNGIYNASSGNWTRTVDADTNDQWGQGLLVVVTSGATYANDLFECTTANPITLSSSAITFVLNSIPATRQIATTAPLAGGGALTSNLSLSITINGSLQVTGGALAVAPLAGVSHQWVSSINAAGVPQLTQPTAADIAGGAALSETNDTNVTLTLGGGFANALLSATSITVGWTGTLAAARLNANVVQAITNDTNVTGSITAQNLTLGWTGTLAAARLNANVVQAVTNDTNVTGSIAAQDLTLGWTGTLAVARGGTGGGAASGTLLDNISGFSSTGFLTRTGAGTYAFISTTNGITNAMLAQMATKTIKGNNTAGTANAADLTVAQVQAMLGAALTEVNDTNVTITLGGSPTTAVLAATSITVGWTGTLAAGRLNANVVQAVTNDTNVTGSITAQNLTFGWTGTLAVARGGTGGGAASGTLLDNISGFSSTGFLTRTGAGTYAFQSATNGITNANLVQGTAATLKGNPTAATANVQDFTIQGLTDIGTPSTTLDWLLIYNHTTGTIEKTNASELVAAVGGGVTSIATNNGITGGTITTTGTIGLATIATGMMLANESGSTGVPVATAIPVLHSQTWSASGSFTTPANSSTSTVYEYELTGSGGGSGGSPSGADASGGAGAGETRVGTFTGLAPGTVVTVTIATGGVAGAVGANPGGAGSASSLTATGLTTVTANGGSAGSAGAPSSGFGFGGSGGAGGTSLPGGDGVQGLGSTGGSFALSGAGGASFWGGGGGATLNGVGLAGQAPGSGAGGSSGAGGAVAGAAGANGFCRLRWVL